MKKNTSLRIKSSFLLLVFLFDLLHPYVIKAGTTKGASASGDGPVAASANNFVDPFTGDFHYSVPLMVVPGPNGENVDISAYYHSSIGMNEQASWLGLGWDFNPGEISCSVNGVPDDGNTKIVQSSCFRDVGNGNDGSQFNQSATFGPLCYNAYNGTSISYPSNTFSYAQNKSFDATPINAPASGYSTSFMYPAFDRYQVSGPGISGKIRPFLPSVGILPLNQSTSATAGTYVTPQFMFVNSTAYSYPAATSPFANSDYYDGTNSRLIQGNYIKYYLNSDISANIATIGYNNTNHTGFLDYAISATPRSTTDFDPSGIGAFEITKADGMTYHYSLPEYTMDEFDISFGLYSLVQKSILQPDLGRRVIHTRKPYLSPSSWKLTAITGPDFQDANNDHVVDQGDTGYWIAYDYAMWTDNFNWSFPFFNYIENADNSGDPLIYNYSMQSILSNTGPLPEAVYHRTGEVSRGRSQLYYLNSIKTATHTAFFIKDLRLDDHGFEKIIFGSSHKPSPKLKLNRIILVRNNNANIFLNTGSFPTDSRFDFTNCKTTVSNLVHMGTYTNLQSTIDPLTLKSVCFNTDYSQCPQLHNNINNTFNTSWFTFNSVIPTGIPPQGSLSVFSEACTECGSGGSTLALQAGSSIRNNNGNDTSIFTSVNGSQFIFANYDFTSTATGNFTTTDVNNTGKLTLKEIVSSETGNTQLFPSYKFTYNSFNPVFNPMYADFFGFNGAGVPGTSHYGYGSVGEWCVTAITTPLGAQIGVNYQQDSYTSIAGTGGDPLARIYILNSAVSVCNDPPGTCCPNVPTAFNFMFDESDYTGGSGTLNFPTQARCMSTSNFTYLYFSGNVTQAFYCPFSSCPSNAYNYTMGGNLQPLVYDLYTPLSGCTTTNATANSGCNNQGTVYYPSIQYSIYSPYIFGPGYISIPQTVELMGGSRVSSITFTDPSTSQNYSQNYTYASGIASANPDRAIIVGNNVCKNNLENDAFSDPPMVAYPTVTVTTNDNSGKQNGYTVYDYNVTGTVPTGTVTSYPVQLKQDLNIGTQNTGLHGKLKKVSVFDYKNNLVAYTKYNYVQSNYIPQSMGYYANGSSSISSHISEYTTFIKSIESYKDGVTSKQTILARDPYTAAPTQTLAEDPSQGGLLTNTQYAYTQSMYNTMGPKSCVGCSFTTGGTTNENNLMRVSQSTTIKYPMVYNAYGTKSADLTNAGYLIGGSKTTYTQSIPYRAYSSPYFSNSAQTQTFWKPAQSSQLVVDANTPGTQTSLTWRQTSSATSFNSSTHGLLEAQGLNGRYTGAVKMGYNNQFKVTESSDASLNCFAFSSFEDGVLNTTYNQVIFGGEIAQSQNSTIALMTPAINGKKIVNAHTGSYVSEVTQASGGYGPGFITKNFDIGRTYQASVWVHTSSPSSCALIATLDGTINGSPAYVYKSILKNDASNITVGNWTLMTLQITVPSSYIASNGTQGENDLRFFTANSGATTPAFFDDMSIHPIDSPISGYVYNPSTGWLTASLDNDNFATTYTYDQAGRVLNVYKETKSGVQLISGTSYNFGRQ